MSVRTVRGCAIAFFLLYAVALTWPGVIPFNRVRPLVLGLPFNLAWGALWIVAGGLVLWWLDRSEARVRAREGGPEGPGGGSGGSPKHPSRTAGGRPSDPGARSRGEPPGPDSPQARDPRAGEA